MKSIDIQSFEVLISEILFVARNFSSQNNKQIAKELGCRPGHVSFLRKIIIQLMREKVKIERKTLKGKYVLANWQAQSDEEMAKHLHLRSSSILKLRLKLGLKRPTGKLMNPKLRLILKEDLERMIFKENKSFAQIGKDSGVSRERIRQIAKGYGIKIRQPEEWQLNKEVLQQGLEEAGSVKEFAHKCNVPETSVRFQIRKFNLHFRQGTKTVKLICAFCGRDFDRPARLLRYKQQKNFFCSRTCYCKMGTSSLLKKDELERMALKEGMTFAQIAKACRISEYRIRQIAKKYGIRARQIQDWQLNKQVLQQGLKQSGSVKKFALKHKVSELKVYRWAKKHNLNLKDIWLKKP